MTRRFTMTPVEPRRLSKAERRNMRQLLWERQDRRCCYCQRHVYLDFEHGNQTATLEHLKRRADGGTDHRDNYAVACARCNSQRGEMSWVEFATLMRPAPVAANSNFARIPVEGSINR